MTFNTVTGTDEQAIEGLKRASANLEERVEALEEGGGGSSIPVISVNIGDVFENFGTYTFSAAEAAQLQGALIVVLRITGKLEAGTGLFEAASDYAITFTPGGSGVSLRGFDYRGSNDFPFEYQILQTEGSTFILDNISR